MTIDRAGAPLGLKVVRSLALAVAIGAAIWHLLPLVVWAAKLEPELSREANAHRLDVPMLEVSDSALPDWGELVHAGVAIRVPLVDASDLGCGDQPGICRRELVGGNVGIHSQPPDESYQEMIDFRAPDRDDLSLLRSATANWRTIQALRTQVTTSRAKLDSWRYEGPRSKGIVIQTERADVPRYVIAAYSPDGLRASTIGISGLPQEDVLRVFGTLRFVE